MWLSRLFVIATLFFSVHQCQHSDDFDYGGSGNDSYESETDDDIVYQETTVNDLNIFLRNANASNIVENSTNSNITTSVTTLPTLVDNNETNEEPFKHNGFAKNNTRNDIILQEEKPVKIDAGKHSQNKSSNFDPTNEESVDYNGFRRNNTKSDTILHEEKPIEVATGKHSPKTSAPTATTTPSNPTITTTAAATVTPPPATNTTNTPPGNETGLVFKSFNYNYLYFLLLLIPIFGIALGVFFCKRRKPKDYMEPVKTNKTRRFSTPSWVFSEPDFADEEVVTLEEEKK